jgi:hypothetical protein
MRGAGKGEAALYQNFVFKPHAACLRSGPYLQAWLRTAKVMTMSAEGAQVRTARAREAESGHKQSLRTVCV